MVARHSLPQHRQAFMRRGWRDAGDRTACRSRFTRLTWESQILPARVRDYSPEMLDDYWQPVRLSGRGKKSWVKMTSGGTASTGICRRIVHSRRSSQANRSALQQAIIAVLADGGAGLHNKSANGYAIKSANRLILGTARGVMGAGLARRHHQRYWAPLRALTRSSSNARTSTRPVTGLVVGVLSMHNPSRRGYLQHTKAGRTLVVIAGGATKRTERMLALAENMLDRYGIISLRR